MQPDELLILTATVQGGYPEAGQGCEFSYPSRMSHLAVNRHHDIWRTTRLEHAQQINNWPGHESPRTIYDRTKDEITLTEVYLTPVESVEICYLGIGRHCEPLKVKGTRIKCRGRPEWRVGPHETARDYSLSEVVEC